MESAILIKPHLCAWKKCIYKTYPNNVLQRTLGQSFYTEQGSFLQHTYFLPVVYITKKRHLLQFHQPKIIQTYFTIPVKLLNWIIFGKSYTTHPLNTLCCCKGSNLQQTYNKKHVLQHETEGTKASCHTVCKSKQAESECPQTKDTCDSKCINQVVVNWYHLY